MDTGEILSAFEVAKPNGYSAKVGDEIVLLRTLHVAENPDYDPIRDTSRVKMVWDLVAPVPGVFLKDSDTRQAKLIVQKLPNPRVFAVELLIVADGERRTMLVPFVVK